MNPFEGSYVLAFWPYLLLWCIAYIHGVIAEKSIRSGYKWVTWFLATLPAVGWLIIVRQ